MTIAEPLALIFTGLYAVLVFLHLRRRSSSVTVPSLLLWEAVPEASRSSRRFRPDLLFLLQFLVLGLLIAGLARPYAAPETGANGAARHVFVLDISASMQTLEDGVPRFEAARRAALRELGALAPPDEVMLIAAGPTPEVVLPFGADRAAATAAIERLQPVDTGGDLAVALAFVDGFRRRATAPTAVSVFTDLARSRLPETLRDAVTLFQVGRSDDNLGIESLQIYQGRFEDPRRARAQVEVRNYSALDKRVVLGVELEGREIERREIDVPARGVRGVGFGGFETSGRLAARLEASDALAADNRAYGWVRPLEPLRLVLVAPPSRFRREVRDLAAAIPALRLTEIDPERLAAEVPPPADVFLFYACEPTRPPAANALYVFPPAEGALFPGAAEVNDVSVLDWNAEHPGLRGLGDLAGLAALPLRRARVLELPGDGEVLLWSRSGEREFPLAFSGRHDIRRYACLPFDLGEESLLHGDNASLLLFFVSLLGWLGPEDGTAAVVRTGEPHSLGRKGPGVPAVRDPRGEVVATFGANVSFVPRLAGEYRVDSPAGGRTVLANFYDAEESDVGRGEPEPLRRVPAVAGAGIAAPVVPATDCRRMLYGAALVALLAEWFFAAARRRASA